MKLKEKLAEDFITDRYPRAHLNRRQSVIRTSYIAGFEKAREMAAQLWVKGMFTNMADFKNIGEEEVK